MQRRTIPSDGRLDAVRTSKPWRGQKRTALLASVATAGGFVPAADAATVIADWVAPSGGAWTVAANWSTDPVVPNDAGETTYDVRIPDGLSITLDAAIALERLDLGRSTYSGTGSLSVSHSLRIAQARIVGLTLTTRGTAALDRGETIVENATLRNEGEFVASASGAHVGGTLRGYSSRFENAETGTLRLEGTSPRLDFSGSGGGMVNHGSIVQSTGSGHGNLLAHRLENSGTIEVLGGTLSLSGELVNTGEIRGAAGSRITINPANNSSPLPTSSGLIDTDGDLWLGRTRIVGSTRVGGTLTMVGDVDFTASSSFVGRALVVDSLYGGTNYFRGQGLDLDSLFVAYGGRLFVEGDIDVAGLLDWQGTVATNGVFRTTGVQSMGRGFTGLLENSGSLRVDGSIGGGSIIRNLAGADLRSDAETRITGGGQIENAGVHVHTGNPLSNQGEIRIPYANSGLLDVQSGRLSLTGGITGAGDLQVARDASVVLENATFAPGGRVSGEGWITLSGNLEPILAEWDVAGRTNVSGSVEFAGPIRQMSELWIAGGSAIFTTPDLELPRVYFDHAGFGQPESRLVANAPLRVRDNIDWPEGEFGGSASIVAAGGITVPQNARSIGIDGVELRSPGRLDFQGSNTLELRNGGRLVNLPSGEVVVAGSTTTTLRDATSAPPGAVANEGTWINRSTQLDLASRFDNAGRIVNESGELVLRRGRSTGAIEIGAGSRAVIDYDYVIDPASSVVGSGAIEIRGAQTVGAGFQMSGDTRYGFRLTVVGDARLGSSVTGGQLEVLADTHVPLLSASSVVVADGGALRVDALQTSSVDLWDGTLLSSDPNPMQLRSLLGRGTAGGDVALAGFVNPGSPPRIPPRRFAAQLSPGGGSRGTSPLGALRIEGDAMLSIADLVIELGGVERGVSYDTVHLTGGIEFGTDALLQVSVLGDFASRITAGDAFEVLSADAGVVGQFANALIGGRVFTRTGTGSFLVGLVAGPAGSTSLVLSDYQPVPEPAAAVLISLGLAALSFRRARVETEARARR